MCALNRLIDCYSTREPLMRHNVPAYMSTPHQCYCFLSNPSLLPPLSPLAFPLSFSFTHTFLMPQTFSTYVFILPFILNNDESLRSPFPASLLSLPRSHHSCSQAPSLAATVSPPPPSELHCECLVQQPQPLLQYAALPCLYCAA